MLVSNRGEETQRQLKAILGLSSNASQEKMFQELKTQSNRLFI
jgi:hypothetical protein